MAGASIGKLVLSNKGGYNLEWQGHRFFKNRDNKDRTLTYWRCIHRNRCNGAVTTEYFDRSTMSDIIAVVKVGARHTHEAEPEERRAEEVVRGIKRKATELPNEPPLKILHTELMNVNNAETLTRLPERQTLYRAINRCQNRQRPNIPLTVNELHIVEPYSKTLDGDLFLQFDSGTDDADRILMFYTITGLRHLVNSRIVLCDGTFRTCPKPFFQLYSFHGIVRENSFPFVYTLTMRKTESTYKRMLLHLKDHAAMLHLSLSPEVVMMDFEVAALNAVRAVLPESRLKGCLFHWGQAIWRQAVVTYKLKVVKG